MGVPRLPVARPLPAWEDQRVVCLSSNLGINYSQMNQHGGADPNHWLTTPYDVAKVDADLAMLASLGIGLIRAWAPVECVIDFSAGGRLHPNSYARNLQDFLTRCISYGISVIPVMGNGHGRQHPRPPYDGMFIWALIQSQYGRRRYADAYVAYVDVIGSLGNVHSWEIASEPYGNLTWAAYPQSLGITKDQVHAYLVTSYAAMKRIAVGPVGFSELQEDEQPKYRTFSNHLHRATYVDDCTDYYSMHMFRATAAQMSDFRNLAGKPKYLSEVGHYNYEDPTGESYAGQPANLELVHELPNLRAVIDLCTKALNSGFELVMPWDVSMNPGMFFHHPGGQHTIRALPRWMQNMLLAANRERVSSSRAFGGTERPDKFGPGRGT